MMQFKDYFGIAASLALLLSIFYALRRRDIERFIRKHWGSASAWRKLHIYSGFVFAAAFLIHTQFFLPVGAFSWWLYILSWLVIITGLLGWGLQWWIPRKLSSLTKTEIIFARIPSLCEHLRQVCLGIAETCPAILADFHNRKVAAFVATPILHWRFDFSANKTLLEQLALVKLRLPEERHDEVNQMQSCIESKIELDVHYTFQTILHLWIFIHAPVSFLLALLVMFHIFAVIYY